VIRTVVVVLALALLAVGGTVYARTDGGLRAHAEIHGVGGSSIEGSAKFVQDGSGTVHVIMHLKNAPPGLHGSHVHSTGDCGGTAAANAGPHYDPDASASHGHPRDAVGTHHAGDLHNTQVNVAENGHGTTKTLAFTLEAGVRSIVGRSIIIHANEDNYTNTPVNGGSGGRIACGLIQAD
jgi:superoxide dismutase, Cu-Zn family